MADLSQLSDEQLSVYRDLLAQKQGGAFAGTGVPKEAQPSSAGVPAATPPAPGFPLFGAPGLQPEPQHGALRKIWELPNTGARQISEAIPEMATANGGTFDDRAKAVSHLVRGAGTMLAPLAAPAAIMSPLPAALAAGTGVAAGKVGKEAARALGAGPGVQDLTEDAAMIGGGMAGSRIPGAAMRGLSNVSRAKQDAITELIPSFGPKLAKLRGLGDPTPLPSAALDVRSGPSSGGMPPLVERFPENMPEPFVRPGSPIRNPIPVQERQPFNPSLAKSTNLRSGGLAEPASGQTGSRGGGGSAPRPMPGAPGSALIRKEIVQQHLGDPNLGPREAVLYGTDPDVPLITQRQVRVVPKKQR